MRWHLNDLFNRLVDHHYKKSAQNAFKLCDRLELLAYADEYGDGWYASTYPQCWLANINDVEQGIVEGWILNGRGRSRNSSLADMGKDLSMMRVHDKVLLIPRPSPTMPPKDYDVFEVGYGRKLIVRPLGYVFDVERGQGTFITFEPLRYSFNTPLPMLYGKQIDQLERKVLGLPPPERS